MSVEWKTDQEYWHNVVLDYREKTKNLAFKAVDLILMPSQETYDVLNIEAWINSADMLKASEEIPEEFTKENARFLLEYVKKELIRFWRNVLELDRGHADEAREWLDKEVISAALAGCKDNEKAKVAEYLDELKEVRPYELLRGM